MDYKIYKCHLSLDSEQIGKLMTHHYNTNINWKVLLEEVGAIRINHLLDGYEWCIINEEKYFLAKIKYGI
jgi:hypothetical protein